MEKKKMKFLKILFWIIISIFVIFIVITVRKIIILSAIDSKISEYENTNNIYSKIVSYKGTNEFQLAETYIKDNISKTVLETKKEDGTSSKMIQITYRDRRKLYFDNGIAKEMIIYNEDNTVELNNIIINYAKAYTLLEKIANSITSNIKTEEVNGKKCYVISVLCNSNVAYEKGTEEMIIYIEKDTSLPVKKVQIINEDGNKNEYTTTYEYEFNSVTNQDLEEPDSNQYVIRS